MPLNQADCLQLDQQGAAPAGGWAALAARFAPGESGTLYFDANSIGPMPLQAPARMQQVLQEGWAHLRRRAWNECDWLDQPRKLGEALAHLIGCGPADVRVTDTTSVNQYKLLRHALALSAGRRVLVLEQSVFPSNRYVAEALAHAGLAELRLVQGAHDLHEALAPGDVAVVALSHVDYRSSERLDMHTLNRQIHAAGALSLWDLSHSAGAVAIDLLGSEADFAVGCGYKYLCGGPGAPSLVYAHPRCAGQVWPAIGGWMGHADTFAFEPSYRPAPHVDRFLVGTPPVLAHTAFSAAAEIWRDVDPRQMDLRHRSLTDTLITLVEQQCEGLGLELASPREHARRGGHVAFRFEAASPLAQALVEHGVVVSARKPDALRWGVHPLVTTHMQIWAAVQVLRKVLVDGLWRDPRHAGFSV